MMIKFKNQSLETGGTHGLVDKVGPSDGLSLGLLLSEGPILGLSLGLVLIEGTPVGPKDPDLKMMAANGTEIENVGKQLVKFRGIDCSEPPVGFARRA